jgi:hypothetical protein
MFAFLYMMCVYDPLVWWPTEGGNKARSPARPPLSNTKSEAIISLNDDDDDHLICAFFHYSCSSLVVAPALFSYL